MGNRISRMSSQIHSKIEREFGKVICRRCGKEIKIEEDYLWKESGNNSKTKRYHIKCAKEVNIL